MLCAIGPTAIKILRMLLDSRDRAARLEKCAGAAPTYASQTPAGQVCQAGKSAKGAEVMDARRAFVRRTVIRSGRVAITSSKTEIDKTKPFRHADSARRGLDARGFESRHELLEAEPFDAAQRDTPSSRRSRRRRSRIPSCRDSQTPRSRCPSCRRLFYLLHEPYQLARKPRCDRFRAVMA